MADIRKVKVADLKVGPIRHESLSEEVLHKTDMIYDVIGRFIGPRETFEVNLMRDMHPEREIDVWLKIAAAWLKYHEVYCQDQFDDDEVENERVGILIGISCGCKYEDNQQKISKEKYQRLEECYHSIGK